MKNLSRGIWLLFLVIAVFSCQQVEARGERKYVNAVAAEIQSQLGGDILEATLYEDGSFVVRQTLPVEIRVVKITRIQANALDRIEEITEYTIGEIRPYKKGYWLVYSRGCFIAKPCDDTP